MNDMTKERFEQWFRNQLFAPLKPDVIFVHPKTARGYEVLQVTSKWDWPRERKMKDEKWWRRRNKKLWRMREEEKRLIQEAYDQYDRELAERFHDDDLMDAMHYAWVGKSEEGMK